MAAFGNVPQLGGYNYEFVSKVPDKLKCAVCLLTLKNPMQVMKCGHRFCKLCISPILNDPPASCPKCRQPISNDKVFEDAACERDILDLHVKCPSKGCYWSGELRNSEMLKHIDVCPYAVIPCKYEHVGCEVKIRRDALQNHVEENMEKHLDLACSKLKQLENTPCSRQLNSISFIWKISEFDQRLQEAKAGVRLHLFSDPFYTSAQGYKMTVRLDPNGYGEGEGSHVSAFMSIMKGEYDGVLTWPFLPKVTFTLIDQQEDGSKRENISVGFKARAINANYFNKPVSESNGGWGFSLFVSHDILQTRRYIVDNTIFLKVQVEVPQEDYEEQFY